MHKSGLVGKRSRTSTRRKNDRPRLPWNLGTYVTAFYFVIVFSELFVRFCEHAARKLTISLDATSFTYRRHVPRFPLFFRPVFHPLSCSPLSRHSLLSFISIWFITSSRNFRIANFTTQVFSLTNGTNDTFTSAPLSFGFLITDGVPMVFVLLCFCSRVTGSNTVRRRGCAQEKMLCNAGRHEFCDVINYLHQRGTDAPQNKSLNLKLCLNFGNELCRGPAAVRVYLVLNVCKSQYGVCGDWI